MIGKLFLLGGIFSFLFFAYYFLNMKWILSAAIFLFAAIFAIYIVIKILRRKKSGTTDDGEIPYFSRLFTDFINKFVFDVKIKFRVLMNKMQLMCIVGYIDS